MASVRRGDAHGDALQAVGIEQGVADEAVETGIALQPPCAIRLAGMQRRPRERNVRLLLWIDSHDLERQGFDKVFTQVAAWGFAGVKIDFMNSDSQETVRWYADVLAAAAKHKLLVDLHGAYKPTGLARTWPNYITQEGVLGNEYNNTVQAVMSGAAGSRVRVTALNAATVKIELDADGNGVYETAVDKPWSDIL